MAKVIACRNPKEWETLAGENFEAEMARQEALMLSLEAFSDKVDLVGDITGLIIRFPEADGYAFYKVVKMQPFVIEHIPYGDAWQTNSILLRGLKISDVIEMETRRRAVEKLFKSRVGSRE